MTLTIHTEQDEQRQLHMTIEVPEERVEKQMRQTARKLARDYRFPGFRQGRAPYAVVVGRIGRDNLRAEAVEELLQSVFEEAMDQVDPDAYAPAEFEDMEMEPLVLRFTIPLMPEVDLHDYRALRKEIEPVSVTEEAVNEALENIRARHQLLEEVERPVEGGDMVTIAGRGELILMEEVEEEEAEAQEEAEVGDEAAEVDETDDTFEEEDIDTVLFDTEGMELIMDAGKLFPGTPFVENLVGLSIGDKTSFSFTFPDDFEDEELAGKEAEFEIEILQVQNRDLPELNDDLAKEEGHESLAEMVEETRANLEKAAESQAKNELIDGMIEDMLAQATLVFPPAAVELEIDNRIESFKQQVTRSGWQWEDYLTLQGTAEEGLREDFREAAEEAVRQQLVLRQFVLEEKLSVDEADVEAKIDERVMSFGDNETLTNSMREFYKKGAGLEMISSEILVDKVAERMKAILSGNAPELEALAEEAEEAEATAVDAPHEPEAVVDAGEAEEAAVEDEQSTAVDTPAGSAAEDERAE